MAPDPRRIGDDLPPGLEPAELERMAAIARRLEQARPLPAPGFRGQLRRRLADAEAAGAMAPRRARSLALSYAASGLLLLAVAAIGVVGSGPFAA
jgi:hypothetical protein